MQLYTISITIIKQVMGLNGNTVIETAALFNQIQPSCNLSLSGSKTVPWPSVLLQCTRLVWPLCLVDNQQMWLSTHCNWHHLGPMLLNHFKTATSFPLERLPPCAAFFSNFFFTNIYTAPFSHINSPTVPTELIVLHVIFLQFKAVFCK